MPGPLDHIAFLSQEIGPRPSGTEEEQHAALYITEQLQKNAELPAEIEDFNSQTNEEIPRAICAFLSLVFAIAAMVFPIMLIPALIVCLLTGALYCAETFDKPFISRFFNRGVSQNVVSKYQPQYSEQNGGLRRRKIIVLANYDSGKVRAELSSPLLLGMMPVLQKASLGAMVFLPLFILIRCLFFLHATGGVELTLNIITSFVLLFAALPLLLAIVHRFSAYSDAANNNASGVAALLEIARRIGKGQHVKTVSDLDVNETHIHGEEAARDSGFVPEGATLNYEAQKMQTPEIAPRSEVERLNEAKAAIAAMTGRKVSYTEQSSIADNLVQVRPGAIKHPDADEIAEEREELRNALTQAPQESLGNGLGSQNGEINETISQQASKENQALGVLTENSASATEAAVPDWYKKAQENAHKKPVSDSSKVVRSRYASALDAAVSESARHFNQANNAVTSETEERIKKMQNNIAEAALPQHESVAPDAQKIPPQLEPNEHAGKKHEGFIKEDETSSSIKEKIPHEKAPKRGLDALIPETNVEQNLGNTEAILPFDVESLRQNHKEANNENNQSLQNMNKSETKSEKAAVPPQEKTRAAIDLPNITAATTQMAPIDTSKMQRAPLAQAEESKQDAAKSLLNMLPSINVGAEENEENEAQKDAAFSSHPTLRENLPSLSGALLLDAKDNKGEIEEKASAVNASSVSVAGSFSSGATGTFAPVGDELLEGVAPEDVYIDDADDSEYEEGITESGAFAGPGYVEMPRSRVRRFFDKLSFRKKKNEQDEVSANEWLDVDPDFDAREVGKERGGWESFQNEQEQDTFEDEFDGQWTQENQTDMHGQSRKDWEGGAVRSHDESTSLEFDMDEKIPLDGESKEAASAVRSEEMQKIQGFRNSAFNTEVWFVALGSEFAHNGGMNAFIKEHSQDLKGSILINLSALGAGELSYVSKEGFTGKAGASSRMKRYIKKTSQALGISIEPTVLRWKESAATAATYKGFQAVSIVGMDGQKPAKFAQKDDIFENIDQESLEAHIDFVTELIRSI